MDVFHKINNEKNEGPKIEPWGTPAIDCIDDLVFPS